MKMDRKQIVEQPAKLILVSEKSSEKNAVCWECGSPNAELYKIRFPPFNPLLLFCEKCLQRKEAERTEKGKPKYAIDWNGLKRF